MTRTRWLTLLLVVSMGFNVFALGVLLSPHVRHHMGPPQRHLGAHHGRAGGPSPKEPVAALRNVAKVMGGRKDARVRAMWQQGRSQMQARQQELALAQAQLEQALISTPYSEPAVLAALVRVRAETQGISELSGHSLLELMRMLSPEERAELKQLMEKQKDTSPKLR